MHRENGSYRALHPNAAPTIPTTIVSFEADDSQERWDGLYFHAYLKSDVSQRHFELIGDLMFQIDGRLTDEWVLNGIEKAKKELPRSKIMQKVNPELLPETVEAPKYL